jgi:hypothetical protein
VFLTLVALAGSAVGAAQKTSTVRLVIDYGDGAQLHLTAIPWREGMTALDALSAAKSHRHGVSFLARGSGASTMVTKIGDLANEGDGRNWLYSVNDKQAEMGAGAYKLAAGDVVLWKFKTYEYNP